ncbi:MAG: Tad domain-containing protein [Asticcacaulis sp.]|nr:Tad domain-containing protein [Asticcacaulis sp.]
MIFAICLVVVVAAIGGAVDMMNASGLKRDMQDAMDAAVLTGVRASSGQMASSASTAFSRNAKVGVASASQSYSSSSSSSSAASSSVVSTTLTGTATLDSPTLMMKLIGINDLAVSVKSVAVGTTTAVPSGAPCIYVLDPSGSQALLVNSGAQVTAPTCEIHVKSTANPAAIFNSGSSLNFKKICVQGANVIKNSVTVPNLSTSCSAQGDPYAGTLPTPSSSTCTYSNLNYSAATQAMQPGVYCGWFNFNNSSATVTFAPGVYVIKNGGWNVNGGTWKGTGVTFYFADTSKIQFNSGISADLSAPSSGTYKNLLMYEASGLAKTQFVLNDSVANKLTGLIWLPSRELTLNAKSGIQSDALTIVVWRLILNNTTWTLTPLSGTSSSSNGSMTNVRLVK